MPDKTDIEADAAAEKAYAAATEAVTPKAAPIESAPEVTFPSKATRTSKPQPGTSPVVEAPKAATPASAPATAKAHVPSKQAAKQTAKQSGKQSTKPRALPVKASAKPAPIATPQATKTAAPKSLIQQLKEKTMETTDFTTKIKTAVGDAQTKAKEAFDKGAATFGEYNEFTKGNVEAVVESGKILATGMQSLGKTFVEDGKNAFEILTAEVKELAAVKSPTDFFKLQADFLRRNFDIAVSNTSKNSEAVLKLASEVAAPISGRVNLAVEKVKKAA